MPIAIRIIVIMIIGT